MSYFKDYFKKIKMFWKEHHYFYTPPQKTNIDLIDRYIDLKKYDELKDSLKFNSEMDTKKILSFLKTSVVLQFYFLSIFLACIYFGDEISLVLSFVINFINPILIFLSSIDIVPIIGLLSFSGFMISFLCFCVSLVYLIVKLNFKIMAEIFYKEHIKKEMQQDKNKRLFIKDLTSERLISIYETYIIKTEDQNVKDLYNEMCFIQMNVDFDCYMSEFYYNSLSIELKNEIEEDNVIEND